MLTQASVALLSSCSCIFDLSFPHAQQWLRSDFFFILCFAFPLLMGKAKSGNNLFQKCVFLITDTMERVNLSGILAIKYRFSTSSLHFQLCHSHLSFRWKRESNFGRKNWYSTATAPKSDDCTVNHTSICFFFLFSLKYSCSVEAIFFNSWEPVPQPTQYFSWLHLLSQLIIPSWIISFSQWIFPNGLSQNNLWSKDYF